MSKVVELLRSNNYLETLDCSLISREDHCIRADCSWSEGKCENREEQPGSSNEDILILLFYRIKRIVDDFLDKYGKLLAADYLSDEWMDVMGRLYVDKQIESEAPELLRKKYENMEKKIDSQELSEDDLVKLINECMGDIRNLRTFILVCTTEIPLFLCDDVLSKIVEDYEGIKVKEPLDVLYNYKENKIHLHLLN